MEVWQSVRWVWKKSCWQPGPSYRNVVHRRRVKMIRVNWFRFIENSQRCLTPWKSSQALKSMSNSSNILNSNSWKWPLEKRLLRHSNSLINLVVYGKKNSGKDKYFNSYSFQLTSKILHFALRLLILWLSLYHLSRPTQYCAWRAF